MAKKPGPKIRALEERFWEKVIKHDGGCWEWTAYRDRNGYGTIGSDQPRKSDLYAHRVSWEIHNGPVPGGMLVCHHCDNPQCTNPKHLFLGTQQDNINDMMKKGRYGKRSYHKGEDHHNSVLSRESAAKIKNHKDEFPGWNYTEIGEHFGVSKEQARRIAIGECWAHV